MTGRASFEFRLIAGDTDEPAGKIALGFEQWADLISDWRPTFRNVITLFRRHEGRHFDSEGSSTGARWAPLSERYGAWKAAQYPGRPILVLTGALRAALVDGRGPGAIEKIGPRRMEIGVDSGVLPYAQAHQTGIPGRLPARPPIRFDGDPRNKSSLGFAVAQAFQRQIVDARKRALSGATTPPSDAGLGSLLTRPTS